MRSPRPSIRLLLLVSLCALVACGRAPGDENVPEPEVARDRTSARVRMAEALLAEGQIASAREQLVQLARDPEQRIAPDNVPAWTNGIIESTIRRGALALADSLLRRTGPIEERGVERQILTANLRVLQGSIDEAVAIYSSIRTDDPQVQVRVLHELATLHMRRGAWQEALDRAREGLALDPGQGPLRVLSARALDELGRSDDALAELERMPPSPARWTTEAEIQLESFERPDRAVALLRRAQESVPRDSGVALLMGRAQLARGNAAAAAASVEPLARRPRPYPGSREVLVEAWDALDRIGAADSLRAELQSERDLYERQRLRVEGLRASRAGDLDVALDRFDRALAIDPSDGELHHDRGVVLARQEQWPAARTAFETAARLRPDDVSILLNLARLFDRTGRAAARDSILARVEALETGN